MFKWTPNVTLKEKVNVTNYSTSKSKKKKLKNYNKIIAIFLHTSIEN